MECEDGGSLLFLLLIWSKLPLSVNRKNYAGKYFHTWDNLQKKCNKRYCKNRNRC